MLTCQIRRPSFAGFLGVRTRKHSLLQLQNPSPTPPRGSGPARLKPSQAGPGVVVPSLVRPFLLPGAFGAFLGPINLRFRALVCFLGAPVVSERPPEASGVDFWSHFSSQNHHFGLLFLLFARACFLPFCDCFQCRFSAHFLFCGRARKRPKSEIRHTLHAKTCFFKVRAVAGAAPRTTTHDPQRHKVKAQKSGEKPLNNRFFNLPGQTSKNTSQKRPPVDPPGTQDPARLPNGARRVPAS